MEPTGLCGICRQTVFNPVIWRSYTSSYAHSECARKLRPLEKNLAEYIYRHFPDDERARARCFLRARSCIEKACGESIKDCLSKKGSSVLASFIDTKGIQAVNEAIILERIENLPAHKQYESIKKLRKIYLKAYPLSSYDISPSQQKCFIRELNSMSVQAIARL